MKKLSFYNIVAVDFVVSLQLVLSGLQELPHLPNLLHLDLFCRDHLK